MNVESEYNAEKFDNAMRVLEEYDTYPVSCVKTAASYVCEYGNVVERNYAQKILMRRRALTKLQDQPQLLIPPYWIMLVLAVLAYLVLRS